MHDGRSDLVVVAHAATNAIPGIRVAVLQVQEGQPRAGLAAGIRAASEGKLVIRQERTHLVADAKEELFVPEAPAWRVRASVAGGVAADAVARADLDVGLLLLAEALQNSGLLAARPGRRPQNAGPAGEERALLVAEAGVGLLVVLAGVPIVHVHGVIEVPVRDVKFLHEVLFQGGLLCGIEALHPLKKLGPSHKRMLDFFE
mmetsp:Transcript_67938/g.153660  ORF Transcript_67938/g.153660 Transcript_67938/m.153660 type:complete len:202 (+) Transcript_67938:172-777(+)